MRTAILFTILSVAAMFATAQENDTIRLTWHGEEGMIYYTRNFQFRATTGDSIKVDWGDGTVNILPNSGSASHTYDNRMENNEEYAVTITATSPNFRFTYFRCISNLLTSLDITKCKSIEYLECHDNQLNTLDLSENKELLIVRCWNNLLNVLILGEKPKLTSLECWNNQLKTVDITNCIALRYFYCGGNQLTTLDVKNNIALSRLDCSYNQLTDLDLSKNLLYDFYCSGNQLTVLDLSEQVCLSGFSCSDNQLTVLDLSPNRCLRNFSCSDNQLNTLILNKDADINGFFCYNNHFPLSDLYYFSTVTSYGPCFGTQRLDTQVAFVDVPIDHSSQSQFGNCSTVFTIERNNLPLPQYYYTIDNGFITFHTTGNYTVIMTNASINSFPEPYCPAQVIVEHKVVWNSGISESAVGDFRVSPNPTEGRFWINTTPPPRPPKGGNDEDGEDIQLFDVIGQQLPLHQFPSFGGVRGGDISHLSAGIYFVKMGEVVKKIVKK